MSSGIYSALSGSETQWVRLDLIANNLANVNTVGYKRDMMNVENFHETLTAYLSSLDEESPTPPLEFATVQGIYNDPSQGGLERTGNQLDVAIVGEGLFSIQTPLGTRYTRAGNFQLSPERNLITSQGHAVLGQGGPITIPPATGSGEIVIDEKGNIFSEGNQVGTLAIVDFADPSALVKEGANVFVLTDPNAEPSTPEFTLAQSSLERSNVNTVTEMVNMIDAQRSFEAYQKTIKSMNDTDIKEIQTLLN